jgi:hypothetical protein
MFTAGIGFNDSTLGVAARAWDIERKIRGLQKFLSIVLRL